MTTQYLRRVSCVIADASGNGLDFSKFKLDFRVQRGDLQTPNSLDLRIFNVAPATANRAMGEFTRIQLQAGYEGNFGQIFIGTVMQIRKGRIDAKDSFLDVTAADGDEAYNFAPMALTLAAGYRPTDRLQAIIYELVQGSITQQLSAPATLPTLPNVQSPRAYTFYGMARDEMRTFCASYGIKWSIQDGVLTFIPTNGFIPGPIPVLSPETGIVGVPTQTISGIEIRTLLNPNIKVGQLVQLQNTEINLARYGLTLADLTTTNTALAAQSKVNPAGLYYVMDVLHHGTTRGEDFFSDLTCLSASPDMIPLSTPTPSIPATGVVPYVQPLPDGG